MENSVYFFRRKGEEFEIYKIPIRTNEILLNHVLTKENEFINTYEVRDYFQIYNSAPENKLYFEVTEHTDLLKNFVKKIVTGVGDIPPIEDFTPRRNCDIYPFDGFAILRKKTDGTFFLGIESISNSLKLYKKGFFQVGGDYSVTDTNKTMLIPNHVTTSFSGRWDENGIEGLNVYFRSKNYQFFEKTFDYNKKWKEKSEEIKTSQNNLNIRDSVWTDYKNDLRNARKFVRCFNSTEGNFENIQRYWNLPNLRELLKFTVRTDKRGILKVDINTEEEMKIFIDAYIKHILSHPLTQDYVTSDNYSSLVST